MPKRILLPTLGLAAVAAAAAALGWGLAAGTDPEPDLAELRQRYVRPAAPPFPDDNPYSPAKARLGKKLFFDQRLSGNNDISCAGCHNPDLGWEDGKPVAQSPTGVPQRRHSPTLWNLAWERTFFWDGRSPSLEDQATRPVITQGEMNQPMNSLLAELRAVRGYREAFAEAFPEADPAITEATLAKAIATYERTIVQPMTRFDQWVAGDPDAISTMAKQGFRLFNGKANCAACHGTWRFTRGAYHDIGLENDGDLGRGPVLKVDAADNAFKTPTLRDVTRRAPYMHDGRMQTLRQVIAHYEDGFVRRETLSEDMRAIDLSDRETARLIAFLKTLETPEALQGVTRPELPQ
jgi:cytochrome c peroxidase